MAQKFRTGSLVSIKGNMYSVLIVKGYDSSTELYTCASSAQASSYKTIARENQMTQCPAGTPSPKAAGASTK
ncbi:MAG: hypothetical protein IT256_05350 [Chitinophagaceae bacterium]|nr:hypothetical protein [Chitinophagaceae bacterium]